MKVIKEKKFIKTCFMIDTFMLFIFSNWGKNDNLSPLLCAVSNSSIDEGCWAHGCICRNMAPLMLEAIFQDITT